MTSREERDERRAAALRANLRRRKVAVPDDAVAAEPLPATDPVTR